ncbi:hypothetical protein C3432_09165 [Citrobacter amalonaticus]|uniref:Uncharacterized protein n=1 Tax=Citrobacter amalonaticus TaxID=35703 RepID=A0A2S4RZJ2_CITAM|nr:hypothetical protein [Citrobacter amalonaticus]POT58081.1 hypothetical protein C3432_09165 [Citrobacter amalonaticus]POT76394.1 hypothetical protein C3436_02660 [Citrobacter amalonaticus]POU66607.1 hypothetical protein C3430_07365 [Citrobacter amalonaticus]POV05629.1 hypothetical protein C3424_09965 [Citrobacter amalonaticus]
MKAVNKKALWSAATLLIIFVLSAWFYLHHCLLQSSMQVNCATILRYSHHDPNFIATLDMIFRLDKNHNGQAILSGNMHTEREVQIVSRTIIFNYEVNRPGEIYVKNMRYVKNIRDTASDDHFRRGFFYVPDGSVRQLRINPSGNGWLIDNLQSPFALCINSEN